MRRTRRLVIAVLTALTASGLGVAARAGERDQASSGKTQVVARLNNQEITIADLRGEMASLRLSANDPAAEKQALQSILRRRLLAAAARKAGLHRRPEALRQMKRAEEEALASLYLAAASQPPEPTRAEIEDFVSQNPELFSKRRIYSFAVLTMPVDAFDEERLTPLFDDTTDFSALGAALFRAGVDFEITPSVQPSDAFPEVIRKQLGQYGVNDNIVVRGQGQAQIMKITAIKKAGLARSEALSVARRALLARQAGERADRLIDALQRDAELAYFRKSAAPADPEDGGAR